MIMNATLLFRHVLKMLIRTENHERPSSNRSSNFSRGLVCSNIRAISNCFEKERRT